MRNRITLGFGGFLVWVIVGSVGWAADIPKFEPTDTFELQEIVGWKVYLNRRFQRTEPELCAETLTLLRHQLYQITRMVPERAVARMREIAVWVEFDEPHHPCMCYHPDPAWLREHDMNPDKARGVEIANARNFLSWTKQQPWMVFHELAHGYHHQFIEGGYENAELAAALDDARSRRLYDDVLHINGRREKHYALTNPMEYFAEQSEAYFGTNDFYPFVRSELEHHDRRMHDLLTRLWEVEREAN